MILHHQQTVAMLALHPLRLKNFADLRIGVTVRQHGASWQFEFSGDEMKNHSPFEPDWPADLVVPLETYLNVYRHQLIARRGRWHSYANEFLWVSSDGSPITPRQSTARSSSAPAPPLVKASTPITFAPSCSPPLRSTIRSM